MNESIAMDDIPDVLLMNVFTFLPRLYFLPISHVSSRFRTVYLQCWRQRQRVDNINGLKENEDAFFTTDPMCAGNLFASSWKNGKSSHPGGNNQNSPLHTSLLQYYVNNGYGKNKPTVLKKVMLHTISRGDIGGMNFLVSHGYCVLDDENFCTMAGAAGQVGALKWLRGDDLHRHEFKSNETVKRQVCPWNPTEVHREAAENGHDDVLEYVERNSEGHQIQTHYGVGLPW